MILMWVGGWFGFATHVLIAHTHTLSNGCHTTFTALGHNYLLAANSLCVPLWSLGKAFPPISDP